MSYIPFTIQVQDPDTEEWTDLLHLHALQVNKTGGGETASAGAEQFHLRLTFEVRWCKPLEDVIHSPQTHRIVYRDRTYNIRDYDDFMEQRRTVRLVGEAYG
jgi:SPP1 family predicted phage head-tail adaptor